MWEVSFFINFYHKFYLCNIKLRYFSNKKESQNNVQKKAKTSSLKYHVWLIINYFTNGSCINSWIAPAIYWVKNKVVFASTQPK